MEEFFNKLNELMSFEMQVYVMMAVFCILLFLCFILLLVVGTKYKRLAEKVAELEEKRTGEDGETEDEADRNTDPDVEEAEEDVKETEPEAEESSQEPEEAEEKEDEKAAEEEEAEAEAEAEAEDNTNAQNEPSDSEAENNEAETEEAENSEKEVPEEADAEEKEDEKTAEEEDKETEDEESGEKTEEVSDTAEPAAVLLPESQKLFNENIENEINALKEKTAEIEKNQRKSFDKIKVVRYSSNLPDGSETVGYSIGITNPDNDGIVLTGTEQADGATALVVKSVKGGVCKVPLSPAEDVAVKRNAK